MGNYRSGTSAITLYFHSKITKLDPFSNILKIDTNTLYFYMQKSTFLVDIRESFLDKKRR